MFEASQVKLDFPILKREVNGHPLVYLDSGATSQKPKQVLDAERDYYEQHNANVHRGAHTLGDEATQIYQEARERVAKFIGAKTDEVIFVRNTTEAINLVAYAWGLDNLKKGDVVVTTMMEHHANMVPWHEVGRRTGARVEVVDITGDGQVDMNDYKEKLKLKPKMVSFVHVSNVLGTINPVKEMTKLAHKADALVLVDGAQAVPHMRVDVSEIGCDFYAFSGHKMLAPMGIGVLWGKKEILENMSPFLSGGGMINEVYTDHSTWAELPDKFEAGTPNVAGAIGLASAIDYLEKLGMENVREHDLRLTAYSLQQLGKLANIKILGTRDAGNRSGSVSFTYEGVHAHDVATVLDSQGVAVRSGHHCTMVLHKQMGISASVRASFNVYTTKEDIDKLVRSLAKVKEVFGK
ncbi:cysteine desulfurase [Candidatus Collierbacteria bacterium CG10_big_fil_rev_8_21_14_0_10_44_9]|uniref:Cysteine desulfurase n=1 Tax=Candidatus Collierbacteria bacterium CG10_big_fil_rev_8_21_14_0_10_44_9 TaxID=1974535 RepID=A0A2H0VLI5_9BACT|nr:MAG: cysteine desulfurase [Candidatus Collierbacteria bacterium CG10_big_fil_rev_8_21_14_0_10_44_9]